MADSINIINVGGIDKEVEDTVARSSGTNANSRCTTLESDVSNLAARVEEIIAPTGEAPSPAEILDARVGYDNTIYDTLGNAIRGQAGDLKAGIDNICKGKENVSFSHSDGVYIDSSTGYVGGSSNYSCAKDEQNEVRIKIPEGCTKIVFNNILFYPTGTGGWATYTSNTGYSTDTYIRGGRVNYIDVQEGDKYFAVCSYKNPAGQYIGNFDITFIYGNVSEDMEKSKNGLSTVTLPMTRGKFVNFNTGDIASVGNYSTTGLVKIPDGCKKILFPNVKYYFASVAGWATYSTNLYSPTSAFIRGGQTSCIDVQDGDKFFAITSYEKVDSFDVMYICNELSEDIYTMKYKFHDKMFAFVGDSVTFGYDDDNSGAQLANPYPKLVGNLLNAFVRNEAISSASLMDGEMAGGGHTPKAWVIDYVNLFNGYDIIGTMIGINDCYRDYTLGTFSDRTADTFYGALHIYMKGMQEKYPPKNGKRLFMIIYPNYENKAATWNSFVNAIIEVAQYYSIPILDLRKECGISPYSDDDYEYWRLSGQLHSPHLTQLGCNVIAPIIANFINRTF